MNRKYLIINLIPKNWPKTQRTVVIIAMQSVMAKIQQHFFVYVFLDLLQETTF